MSLVSRLNHVLQPKNVAAPNPGEDRLIAKLRMRSLLPMAE
jgi:hypothetical protein